VSVFQNIGKTVGGIGRGIGRVMTPAKKTEPPKNFIQETPEEYAKRLMMRRSSRH
jgi:hypothetical protein